MNDMTQEPQNMSRVLLSSNNGVTLSFGYFKDGMYLEDNAKQWRLSSEYDGWLPISELKKRIHI